MGSAEILDFGPISRPTGKARVSLAAGPAPVLVNISGVVPDFRRQTLRARLRNRHWSDSRIEVRDWKILTLRLYPHRVVARAGRTWRGQSSVRGLGIVTESCPHTAPADALPGRIPVRRPPSRVESGEKSLHERYGQPYQRNDIPRAPPGGAMQPKHQAGAETRR